MTAKAGRARLLAQCGCSLAFNCETEGEVYADVWFELNNSPVTSKVMVGAMIITISPESGTALETTFRISTLAASDPDAPLTYSFYCSIGADESILLASHLEHLSDVTILPYNANGVDIWVEVCDSFGACSKSNVNKVFLNPGEGKTLDTLLEDIYAHNTQQTSILQKFTEGLQRSIKMIEISCIDRNYQKYTDMLLQLNRIGLD
ncbi:unnamed protein product [Diatraea saccharalis]|uniref:PKD/REJ-like domain-containing protein n=1 Tax=Diatraea saccharalis TaxID=40085 RepID=A0A9N9R4S7_9NEOP|nr:unnamed protein product [Diatraea saccharalis]